MRLPLINAIVSQMNLNCYIVGYRGYGPSTGSPSEVGLKIDGLAIMDYLFNELKEVIDTTKIFIMGRSLGGAVAINSQADGKYPIKGMILENTFLSIDDLVYTLFPSVKFLKNYILKNHWPSKDLISKIKVPLFFIIAEKDELIPPMHMMKLKELASTGGVELKRSSVS